MFKNKIIISVIIAGLVAVIIYNFSSVPDYKTISQTEIEQYMQNMVSMNASPIKDKNLDRFDFFEADKKWLVNAEFSKIDSVASFDMLMTDSTYAPAKLLGQARFYLGNKEVNLLIFEEEETYLLPFTDLTNNVSTYGGGRYINLPKNVLSDNKIIIDFNRARNYYCAYNEEYICPIPPIQNKIEYAVTAGEKRYKN